MKNLLFIILLCLPTCLLAQERPVPSQTKLAGRVVDSDGNPIAGVDIFFADASDRTKAPNGYFDIPTLAVFRDASVDITVIKEGYYLATPLYKHRYRVAPEERETFLTIVMIKQPLPAEKKRIAVLPFCDDSADKPLIEGAFTSTANDALEYVDKQKLECVPSSAVRAAMQQRQLNRNTYCDINEIVKMSEDLNANIVVMGMYKKNIRGTWRVTCEFIDLQTKQAYWQSISEEADNLISLQEQMYTEILKLLNVGIEVQEGKKKLKPEAQQLVKSYTTEATQNEKAYTKHLEGAQYAAEGRYDKATEAQSKAIEEDRDFFRAYEARGTVYQKTGKTQQAQADFKTAAQKAKKKGIAKRIIDWIKTPKDEEAPTPNGENITIEVKGVSFTMIYVEGGTFTMGCTSEQGSDCASDEKPVREVTLSDYYVAETEVTQKLWRAVMRSDPEKLYNKGCDDCPVENVSWNDCKSFIKELNTLTDKTFRLPTEAEWEFAARGGNKSKGYKYAGSNDIDEVAWYGGNYQQSKHGSEGTTHPVKTKQANELGIYDMSGNVFEWCEDDWHSNYEGAPSDGSAWTDNPRASHRVLRGGSWLNDATDCRIADRGLNAPDYRDYYNGFRLLSL
ncbi:MAG: SUMF1/EgtB/PvdO family nonheme iron enzyme [Bernardetiaceae bacterium]|nr:SUMF1/EgtB/PvdO family nonheme iron enzyme [Bernardetiaceae bacterium]